MIPNFYQPFYIPPYPNISHIHNKTNIVQKPPSHCFPNKDVSSYSKNNTNFEDDTNFFEIFGLKLYFDDLLIIALLFFLYEEDVKDTYLYIILILLLLS